MTPVLRATELSAGYGKSPVLHDISFAIYSGQFWGLLGQNGSGKTTLLNCISGTIPTESESITIAGSSKLTKKQRARIASRNQDGIRPTWLTVKAQTLLARLPWLRFGGFYSKKDQEIANNALRIAGVLHLADREIRTLSAGQWQLTTLAAALAQIAESSPALLLLDEPAANLDLNRKIEIFRVLRRLCGEGLAILAAIHDCSLAANFCSHLLGLKNGSQLFAGPIENVLTEENLSKLYDYPIGIFLQPNSDHPCIYPLL